MATIQIDRLLETVVKKKASDLHLAVGKPPTLRLHGSMRELQTKVLDAEDTMSLMKSITPERIQQEFEETGRATSASPTARRPGSASPSSSRRASRAWCCGGSRTTS
jgi:Tfp pilus assembly pilus retraction ATPase PilT